MQKWFPEPFDQMPAVATSALVDPEAFEAAGHGQAEASASVLGFRSEVGFTDTKSLMNSLTKDERSQVYELVEIDLIEEYKQREADLRTEFESRLAEAKAESSQMFDAWTENIAAALASELRDAAAASSRLAVQIAAKIVRRVVAVEPEALARVIEATLFKISARGSLTIQANPVDAAWLEGQPGLTERLGVGNVVADRRVERGGCLIQCEGREWDATLTSQLDTLGDIVGEMIVTTEADSELLLDRTTQDQKDGSAAQENPDVSGVE